MDYKKKVALAERVAEDLQGSKTTEQIKAELGSEGLYDRDINSVMVSARKMLGEKFQSIIQEHLIADKDIFTSDALAALDKEQLQIMKDQEVEKLGLEERKKITQLLKEGEDPQVVLNKVDTRFLTLERAATQINNVTQIKKQNSGSGRMLNIGGGIALIVLTGVIMMAAGRLFYVLPIIGLIMIIKGFTTERMEFED